VYRSVPKAIIAAFNGKPPALFWRLLDGQPRAWGKAARAPRQKVLNTLARLGLTLTLVDRAIARRGHTPYTYQVGSITSL
jgi:hypothetical protein